VQVTTEKAAAEVRRAGGRGRPLLPKEPRTLAELFLHAADEHPRSDALNYKRGGEWCSTSSDEMVERASRIAGGLLSMGLRPGDRAAILAPNSPEWTLADAGCQFGGIIDVPIYTTLAPGAVEYILRDSGARALFLEDAASFQTLRDVVGRCPELEHVVLFREDPGRLALRELEEKGSAFIRNEPELLSNIRRGLEPDDLATLIYTSGTTGEPKGVMLSHANIISNVLDAGEKYTFSELDKPLSVLPLSHIFERSAMYLYIFNGMAVHYAESVEKVPDNLAEVRPNILVAVPRIFEKVYARAKLKAAQSGGLREAIFDWSISIAKQFAMASEQGAEPGFGLTLKHAIADKLVYSKIREFFGGNLDSCISGGAALSDEIYLIFTGAGIRIMQGYGLTETSPVLTSNNPEAVKLGTVGRPIRNVELRIAEDGEIQARGPGVMLGYYRKPEATREAFTDDGWFRTGDIGTIDEEGYLSITDRKKELFKTSGGKYIAPSPIEQLLRGSRFVSQAVLVGNEKKFVSALIVPDFDQLRSYARHKGLEVDTEADFCRHPAINDLVRRQIDSITEGLSRFETIKKFALLERELTVEGGELTPTLKIKRRVIEEKYADIIDGFYRDDQ
jgi:long-chain acyl-CoA synthetase